MLPASPNPSGRFPVPTHNRRVGPRTKRFHRQVVVVVIGHAADSLPNGTFSIFFLSARLVSVANPFFLSMASTRT